MAAPINFKPKSIDPRKELERRLEAAPMEHAESILVALDVLEAAHRKGLLHLAEGAISSKDAVFAKLAEYAKQPESTNAIRNALALAKILGSLDPDALDAIARRSSANTEEPPSLFKLLLRAGKRDVRRGLSAAMDLLAVLGGR